MNEWVELRCEAIRLALRITGFPTEQDLVNLVEWLGRLVILKHDRVPASWCQPREDGRAEVTLPLRLIGRRYDEMLAHELGHVLLSMGMGPLLRYLSDQPRILTLALGWDTKDEALARAFVLAWYLPSRLVALHPDNEELCFLSGCDWETVQRRREMLRGRVVELTAPPKWSATNTYHLFRWYVNSATPLVCVAERGSYAPKYSFTTTPTELEAVTMQLTADLVALTAREFEIRNDLHRSRGALPQPVDLEALKQWARKRGR